MLEIEGRNGVESGVKFFPVSTPKHQGFEGEIFCIDYLVFLFLRNFSILLPAFRPYHLKGIALSPYAQIFEQFEQESPFAVLVKMGTPKNGLCFPRSSHLLPRMICGLRIVTSRHSN